MENIKNCSYTDRCNRKDCDKDFCLRKYKLDNLYSEALMSDAQKKHVTLRVDADGTDLNEFKYLVEIEKNIFDFVSQGKNLYLHSATCGNGKTSFAIRCIEAYFEKIWPMSDLECRALFINVPRFLLALKENISEKSEYITHIKENILNADLVIWDDIANKVGTEYEINQLLSFIDMRIASGKSNIYTSNLNTNQVTAVLGERLASRICNLSIDVELHGADKRSQLGGNN